MNRVIDVTISPQGEVSIQTVGYSGSSCQEASRFLEQALGIPRSDRKTPEFYQTAEATQQQQQ
ncbi:MAG: DUF2997 domain-containing protein [Gemmataceae bacterium]|nr:DUF2997 domain-containing protein [Gemmataceae bacterium]